MPIRFSLRKYYNPVFLETGSFHGEGIVKALRAGFKKIYSIELNEQFYHELQARFKKEIDSGRVVLMCGDSSVILPEVIRNIDAQITFWLDAHYCGGDTARGREDSPLLKELDAIARHSVRTHTILVDDVRLFGTNANEDWTGVRLEQVMERVRKINPCYRIRYENGQHKNDVLVAETNASLVLKTVGAFEELITPLLGLMARWIRRMAALKGK